CLSFTSTVGVPLTLSSDEYGTFSVVARSVADWTHGVKVASVMQESMFDWIGPAGAVPASVWIAVAANSMSASSECPAVPTSGWFLNSEELKSKKSFGE